MIDPTGSGVVRARRIRRVRTDRLDLVVIDVDATEDERALAVLQASLHELEGDRRVVYGYDLHVAGLGAWVGDHHLRLRIWPAIVDGTGRIVEDRHEDPDADVLTIEIDPREHAAELAELRRLGRLAIAGPESGPVPLLLELDTALVDSVLREFGI